MNELFQSGVQQLDEELEKSQKKVVSSQKGLKGSLYFKISRTKQILNVNSQQMQQSTHKASSTMMNRQIQLLVHNTLKQMILNKNQKAKASQETIEKISYNEFKQYRPIQLLGLLYLRPEFIKEFSNKFLVKIKKQIQLIESQSFHQQLL